jgi:hypothetical protein
MTLARQRYMVKGIGLALILSLVVVASYSGTGYGKEYLGEEEVLPAHSTDWDMWTGLEKTK